MILEKIQIHQVLIALILGAVLGAAGIQLRDYGCLMGAPHQGAMRKHMIKKMERTLKLDAEQKKQIETLFETMQPRMKALREEMRPKFEAMREETRAEIRKILKPEQLPEFEKLNQKMDLRWKKYRASREEH